MNWVQTLIEGLRGLYRGFVLRDVLGYIAPGALVGFTILHPYETDFTALRHRSMILKFLADSKLVIAVATLASAYVIGISIFGLGVVTGLLRYYPLGMSRWEFDMRYVQVSSNQSTEKFSARIERYVVLLHTTGSFGIAFLICYCYLVIQNVRMFHTALPLLFLGVASLIRHWETVYNLRSFQQAVLTTNYVPTAAGSPPGDDRFGKFLDEGGLIGLVYNCVTKCCCSARLSKECCPASRGGRCETFATAGPRSWAVTSSSATGADIASSYITRAAIAIAPSARPRPAPDGWHSGRQSSCPSLISTWCLPCRSRSVDWRFRTRRRFS